MALRITDQTNTASLNKWAKGVENDVSNLKHQVQIHDKTTTALTASVTPVVNSNVLPPSVTLVSGGTAPTTIDGTVYVQVTTNYTAPAVLGTFAGVFLVAVGYSGSSVPVKVGEDTFTGAAGSAVSFTTLLNRTKEAVTFYVVPKNFNEQTPTPWTNQPSFVLTLNGSVSAPAAPTGVTAKVQALGNSLTWNANSEGNMQAYNVYRNTTNVFGSATKVGTVAWAPSGGPSYFDKDVATGTTYFYWITAVNKAQLESANSTVASAIPVGVDPSTIDLLMKGTLPPICSDAFTYTASGTSLTWSWPAGAIYRPDGTQTAVASGSQTITGLVKNIPYYFYPYWNESNSTLNFIQNSDVTYPTLAGYHGDGITGLVFTTTSAAMPTSFSVELWVKLGTTFGYLISYGTPQGGGAGVNVGLQLWANSASSLSMSYLNGASGATVTTNSVGTLNDGAFHHIVITQDAGATTYTLYVDGVQVAQNAAITMTSVTGYWHIGYVLGKAGFGATTSQISPAGNLFSHVAVYPTVLSATQVQTHYQVGVNTNTGNLEAVVVTDSPTSFWKLTENAGTTAADSVGTNTGTYQATCTLNVTAPSMFASGSPAIAFSERSFLAMQKQISQGYIPLSNGAITGTVPTAGSGGGSGGGTGGGGGCFTPNTKVLTSRGAIPFTDVREGDFVLTAKGTWKPVREILIHDFNGEMWDMGDEELSTMQHMTRSEGRWKQMGEVLETAVPYEGKIYNLEVDTDEDIRLCLSTATERSYTLANGRVVHNGPEPSK